MTNTAHSKHAIAIVGLGSRFPQAKDADEFWDNIAHGRTAFEPVLKDRWNHEVFLHPSPRATDKSSTRKASYIHEAMEFAALHYGIAPRRLEVMDPQHRLLIEATRWALQDAGYETKAFNRARTGVYVGISVAEYQQRVLSRMGVMQMLGGDYGQGSDDPDVQAVLQKAVERVAPIRGFTISGNLGALGSGSVAQTFDLGGPAISMDTACASASIAIHTAVTGLRAGAIDAAVAGGVYISFSPVSFVGFARIGAHSRSDACRPFEARSDGFLQSDGVGVLFLKRLEDALADGDRIHGVIRGSAANNDGRGEGPMTPRVEGQLRLLKDAYADAGVSPGSISYFEAHGTATSAGDPVEIQGLGQALIGAGVTQPAPVGSVKANIGHAMSAAGVAGMVKALKTLEHQTRAPQPDFQAPNPKLKLEEYPLQISTELAPITPRGDHPLRVAVSSFGFGGTNSHIILEAPPARPRPARFEAPLSAPQASAPADQPWPESVLLTAPTPALLKRFSQDMLRSLDQGAAQRASLADLAYTLNARRKHERIRAALPATDLQSLKASLQALAEAPLDGSLPLQLPLDGGARLSVYDAGPADQAPPKLAYMFPGQGAQRVGLMADLRARFAPVAAALQRFDAALDGRLPQPLSSYIYPADGASEAAEAALTATEVAQPALAALSLAMKALLDKVGLAPSVSLGHSLGEFTALASGGMLRSEEAVRLVATRGQVMRALALPDPGAMAAVRASRAEVEAQLAGQEGVWIANINQPRQVTISGTTEGVRQACERLEQAGLRVQPLTVSHAFHSPLFSPMAARFSPALDAAPLTAPASVVASGVADAPYTEDLAAARARLAGHATASVDFVGALRQAREAEAQVFIQLGAGSVLTRMAQASLGGEAQLVELCPQEGDRGAALVHGLCQLAAMGLPVDFEALYAGEPRRVVSLPETPLVRQSYNVVKDKPQPRAHLDFRLPADAPRLPSLSAAASGAVDTSTDSDDAGAAGAAATPAATAELARLFQQQNALFLAQTQALLAQNQALAGGVRGGEALQQLQTNLTATQEKSGGAAVLAQTQAILQAAEQQLATQAAVAHPLASLQAGGHPPVTPPQASAAPEGAATLEQVYAVVAKVSAFPQDSLRASQRLVDDLGFDSLMVTDLIGELSKQLPGLGELPPELFNLDTTLESLGAQVLRQLGATPAAPAQPATPAQPAPAQPGAPASAQAELRAELEAGVYEVVAQVSAFPQDSLRDSQGLVTELGFDSLMVADLIGGLDKRFPGQGSLPPELFNERTTLGDVTAALLKAAGAPAQAAQAAPAASQPLQSYRWQPRPAPQPRSYLHPIEGETWLVAGDGPLAEAVAAALADRGAQLLKLGLAEGPGPLPALQLDTPLAWPADQLAALPAALKDAGHSLGGLIYVAPPAAEAARPVAQLHALAAPLPVPRIAAVTALGGRAQPDAAAPRLSGLAGYLKSLARERPQAAVRALDVDPAQPEAAGRWVVSELLSPERGVQAGFDGQRWRPQLEATPLPRGGRPITAGDVLLITGGSGDVARLLAQHLAPRGPKAILLVGRRTADAQLSALLDKLRPHTAAHYLQADLTQPGALQAALRDLPAPTRILHAAGRIEDTLAERKPAAQLAEVIDVKLAGLAAALEACPQAADVLLFSSWAGSFGNRGQVDYAAANAALDAIAEAGLPGRRVCSVAWPPWEGTGMVSTIPAAVKDRLRAQGVSFVLPEQGLQWAEAALCGEAAGCWIVGQDLPALELRASLYERFDLASHPYLDAHRLRGRAVLPFASVADWLASAGSELLPGEGPIRLAPLNLTRGIFGEEQVSLQLKGALRGDRAQARFELLAGDKAQLAYEGELQRGASDWRPPAPLAAPLESPALPLERFFAEVLFHGPAMQAVTAVTAISPEGVVGTVKTSDRPALWRREDRAGWAIDPLMLDGAFQLAAYWLHQYTQKIGFPTGVSQLHVAGPSPKGPVTVTVRLGEVGEAGFAGDIHLEDADGRPVAWLQGVQGRFADVRAPAKAAAPEAKEAKAAPPEAKAAAPEAKVAKAAPPEAEEAGADAVAAIAAEVPDEHWKVEAFTEVIELGQRLEMAQLVGLEVPYFHVHEGTARDTSVVDGVELINFSSYNYLGYSGHPEVVQAVQDAVATYGSSVSASRVASGERPLHGALERGLAEHVGVDDAIVFTAGHATNVTTVGHMFGREDLILHDALIHDSILQGIYLSGATRRPFPHADLDAVESLLKQLRGNFRRVLIVTEGIYSMDGDICDVPRLIELKHRYRTMLMIDEAHSTGVLGPSGRGVAHHFEGVDPRDVDIWMGTLSKSFASCGGFIAGSAALVRYLKYTAPGFVYSAGITPANAAAALKSLELMRREPEVVQRLRDRSRFFMEACQSRGIDTGLAMGAAVVPAIVGNSMECMQLAERMKARQINVQPIVYPAVEDAASRLRFFISALHSEAQLTHTAEVLAEELAAVRAQNKR